MKTIYSLVMFVMLFSLDVFAAQIIKWKNLPLTINLEVGAERIIQVDDNVILGVPASIKKYLKADSAQGYIYLTATKAFPKTRFKLRMKSNNEVILVDLVSSNKKSDLPNLKIEIPSLSGDNEEVYSASGSNRQANVTPIQLTRFAARSFYGPSRLMDDHPNIRMQKVKALDLSTLFTGKSLDVFDVKAIGVFRSGDMHLTAIKLVNKTMVRQAINFHEIDADFQFATSQFVQVNQKNVHGDTNMLYLITKKPLANALYQQPNPLEEMESKDGSVKSNS
jgi:integrating conjugative element protein (TIGR03749 family)